MLPQDTQNRYFENMTISKKWFDVFSHTIKKYSDLLLMFISLVNFYRFDEITFRYARKNMKFPLAFALAEKQRVSDSRGTRLKHSLLLICKLNKFNKVNIIKISYHKVFIIRVSSGT